MKPKQIKDHTGLLSSVFAIVLGLIVGLIILFLCNPKQALPGFATILSGAFTHGAKGVGQVFYYATPIILTGLSVGFAFKTGLFNIGTPGQFIMGGFGAVYVGILWTSLGPAHWVAALLASIILGAVWGLVPGLLKAYFNVNEVIASIMMNYIGMYLVNWIVKSYKPLFNNLRNESRNVAATANIPKMGLDKIFPGSSVNGGILIAIITVILIWILLNKTTFGYELKAVGFNRDASKYAGINEKKSIILSMMIAGAIAGLAGGLLYLAGTGKHIEIKDVLASEGFTGISVALLGLSNPIGVLFSGIFIAYLTAGGFYLQLLEFSTEIIDIIVAVIIYFSAFALMVKIILAKIQKQKAAKTEAEKEGGTKS
ncbi:ABC transporter permease [Lacrimispora saccharolytica]|uniref:Inner-membrane translocator n=1 Tax=Lacrimispora saccharolytica (strain ATCC 35040 / DSM 2544 / NRCC 2533 / WM1) TaxID=610130 RepID=D9R6M4_LACSW|nr:ABC transporter permease [Lacrimispora saccharolytica]ADL03530.1 inner-membrane translocator [[Clostridium] saccharolyticum WM1]QRV18321.1 ABC transporter permease [Lacrimispora saccharolytica]